MNPYVLDMENWKGYDVKNMKDYFRVFKIIKNRKGKANVACGLYFNPQAGFFKELPEPNELKNNKKLFDEVCKGEYF